MQIIETSFCLLLSWVMYEILLRRETFFQLNRAYLLLMSVAAFVLPLLHFGVHHEEASPVILPFIIENNEVQSVIYQPFIQKMPLFYFTIGDVLQSIFFIGFFYKSTRLLRTLWQINTLIRAYKANKQKGITFLTTAKQVPTASFFSYVFWNEKDDNHQDFILQHELVHVRQWHTIDVLLMEFLLALQWFNPLMYYFRNRLKEVHEFIADEFVVQQTGQRYQYAAVLVEAALKPSTPSSVVNTFSSFTKQRLIMLAKNRSPFWKATKYFLVLPLFCAFILLFSFDLIAKIPTPLPQMEAFLDNFQKQSITIQNLSLLNKVKENGSLIIHELKTPSTVDKNLSGKILLSNDNNKPFFDTFSSEQNKELGDFLAKKLSEKIDTIKSNRMDFKWGEIGIMTKKVTKEILLNSILQQPVLFNFNGQPIKSLNLRLGHVPKIGGDAFMMDIKSDLIDHDVYSAKLKYIHKAMSCVKPKDTVYFDNITGIDKNGNSLTFSIVLEIIE